jgi:hypothetical protein
MKINYTAIALSLILAIAIIMDPLPMAAAGNLDEQRPIRLYATETGRNVLVASLINDQLTVNDTVKVAWQTAPPHRYTLRPPAGQGSSLSVAARSTRQLQIQVTDENDKPVADLAILFSLSDACLGTLGVGVGAGTTAREKTDNRGIATIPWVVGAAKCAGAIAAMVEGTTFAFTYQVAIRAVAGWQFDIEEGQTNRSKVSIDNTCSEPHLFRIKSNMKYLHFEEPTDAILIGGNSTKQIGVVFDATGLKSKVYRDKVVVECRDCKKGRGCHVYRHELAVEMSVTKR